jgi:protoheme IX farnesyltransferase
MLPSTTIDPTITDLPPETRVRDYVSLLKPRVMSLVIFSGLVGLLLAPGTIHPLLGFTAILCIALGSGASGAINMWYDRDIDAIMKRTQNRPIPAGRMLPADALEFGITLAVASVFIMAVAVNLIAAGLLAAAILFYVFIYTMWLKRSSPQNIVIGGAAGAFPPMIGWAAVTGSISLESLLLFAIIFMWTPPHFWALALFKSEDYAKAGVPMYPVVYGDRATKKQMVIYTILLLITTLVPVALHMSGMLYGIAALALGIKFLHYAILVYRDEKNTLAPKMFKYSILYLFLILTFLVLDKIFYALQ